MKTLFAVLALFVSVACVKDTKVTEVADAGVMVVEPPKVESTPQSVNPQITDAVTQSKPAVEVVDAGATPQ
jgi:hypothetical protein